MRTARFPKLPACGEGKVRLLSVIAFGHRFRSGRPMPQIIVEDLVKTFAIAERAPGLWGAVRGLARRRHREVRALDGVSFAIERGELVGYIGPNGAGKSTTVKALSGILVPDSGRCEVAGRVPWKQRLDHVARIGVVFGQRTQLWWDLPVVESFELLRDIYRVPPARFAQTRDALIALLELAPLVLQATSAFWTVETLEVWNA